jgi:hypothetical protein
MGRVGTLLVTKNRNGVNMIASDGLATKNQQAAQVVKEIRQTLAKR